MYTETGKNHLNLHTAGIVNSVASHISMGIDLLNTGTDDTPVTERYLGAFEAASIDIENKTVIDNNVIFATSYERNDVPPFLGNVMGLVYRNPDTDAKKRIRKPIFNDFSSTGWQGTVEVTDSNRPAAWPDINNGMIIQNNTTATIDANFNLTQYMGDDHLSIPVFFVGADPAGASLTITFTFKVDDVNNTYSLSDTLSSPSSSYFKFSNSKPSLNPNGVLMTTNLLKPHPIVWQKRLNSGTTPDTFLKNMGNINRMQINWTCSSACKLYVGSPQLTPDYDADSSSVVVAYGNLSADVTHSGHTYLALEYRLPGV